MSGFDYVGSELELFAEAIRWKRYFADEMRPFLGSRVLEVGAVWDRLMVPASRTIDPVLGRAVGKSVLAVWRKRSGETSPRAAVGGAPG